jgi:CubicO group peptidase (beta-lactamase class C family)
MPLERQESGKKSMNPFERALTEKFNTVSLPEITPGVVVDVHQRGQRRGLVRVGQTYDYYDLASLTKILFTASVAMRFFTEEGVRAMNVPVRELLLWWNSSSTTPARLMTHTAGLEWWQPYYQKLEGPVRPETRWPQLLELLSHLKPKRSTKAVYSDPDLWMMGAFLEACKGLSLLEMWDENANALELGDLFFHPENQPRYARDRYAPTESCPWRGRILQGEVHDENGWALGGVAPHTGLFGTVEAVSDWGLKLRRAFQGDEKTGFGDPKMVHRFVGRRIPRAVGDWGYGFMKPTKGRASCGRYFHADSFGHTGFTGTSLWFDPKQDLLVVILSNRVHPTRENNRFVQFRPQIHDWICNILC